MLEDNYAVGLAIRDFSSRFRHENLGLVYYPNGLGKGGRLLTQNEADRYIDGYAEMLMDTKRWSKIAVYTMFCVMVIGLGIANLWSFKLGSMLIFGSTAFLVAGYLQAAIRPILYKRLVSEELSRLPMTGAMTEDERIALGLAWPWWQIILFYLVVIPIAVFLTLHKAGPNALPRLLGPELAHDYETALRLFLILILIAAILMLPYALIMRWQKGRNRNPN